MSDKLQFVARVSTGFRPVVLRDDHRLKSVPQNVMRAILISLLKLYKAVISPWLPPSCRFVPTCSEYAREAIERHGALRGSGMAVWRLLRCQPFCVGGYDPVK
jgi:putative membrane protein insertion efficiency factor